MLSKLDLVAENLRRVWADYDDTNIYIHEQYHYSMRHAIPEWQKFMPWVTMRKTLRASCQQEKRPFIYAEKYGYSDKFTMMLDLPNAQKHFPLCSNLLLVAAPTLRKYGRNPDPVEFVRRSSRIVFHFNGDEGKEIWHTWLDAFLNNADLRKASRLPQRVNK
jgi:hypothetical protein